MSKLAIKGGPKAREKPFHRWPHWDEREKKALLEVLEEGSWGGYPSPNKKAKKFAEEFSRHMGSSYGVACANGSVALELALWAMGLKPGDEVIVPAYTFVATASSVVFCHGVPVFVDVDPNTYCIDPKLVEKAITAKTRAIIPVHLACNMADMDALAKIAQKHDLILIEDCAHAHGHRWKEKYAGTIGHFGTFSFQTSKLMTSGEGGIVLTQNEDFYMRLQSLVNCGRKEPGYDRFDGRLMGKNYRISEWHAALLSVQLERLEEQTTLREERTAYLEEKLKGMEGVSFTKRDPRNSRRAAYQFIVKYDSKGFKGLHRDKFLEALKAEGIPAEGDFYVPLYEDELFAMDPGTNPLCTLEYAKGFDLKQFNCPVAAKAAYEEAVWLPHTLFLGSKNDVDDIVRAFSKIREHLNELL